MAYSPYGGPIPHPAPLNDVGSTIRDAVQDFCTNFNTGNYDHCAAMYTPEGYFMASNREMVQGRQSIQRALQQFADQGYEDLRLETLRVENSGDMAVEIGRYAVSIRQPNGTTVIDRGKYLSAWRRFGAWLKTADCWSSNVPLVGQNCTREDQLSDSENTGIIGSNVSRSA
ncbi:MAG TPA: nuclear transport factor 2 family protein [Terriglobales bacterium]|nr:nuclear transport factor 2 family protein [Terriglobales bacterium]